MKESSEERYRTFVWILLVSAVLLVAGNLYNWTACLNVVPMTQTSSLFKSRNSSNSNLLHDEESNNSSNRDSNRINLSVEDDEKGMEGKCVAIRIDPSIESHQTTFELSEAVQVLQNTDLSSFSRLQVGLIFMDLPDGFISSGKVVDDQGVFHLYHYLEFLLVAYQQIHVLQEQLSNTQVEVSWIYVPLMQAPVEVCGVANGMNCEIAKLLLGNPTWYGMESNPPSLQEVHPAYEGQHAKRQWKGSNLQIHAEEKYREMQDAADMAFIFSLRRRDRCNHQGLDQHGWNEYTIDFPMDDWHSRLTQNLASVPLPAEFSEPSSRDKMIVCYVDRQATPRRMPDAEHEWLVEYLSSQDSIEFWHLLMQNYSGLEQLKIASQCEVMIGVHGNGLSHVLWMPPRHYVLEMHWDDKRRQGGYEPLSKVMNHTYMGLRQGLLQLDGTSPHYDKLVQRVTGDPLENGRHLIANFVERALTELGYPPARR